MSEILFHYQRVNSTSWAYLSSLLVIALFFKFSRLWSVRNIDLVGIILFAPGLIAIHHGLDRGSVGNAQEILHGGYIWLFVVGGFLLVRMLIDSTMTRRPQLEPNLSTGGLAFLGISLFLFLMANVVNGTPGEGGLRGAQAAEELSQRQQEETAEQTFAQYGPGLRLILLLPQISTRASAGGLLEKDGQEEQKPTKASSQDTQPEESSVGISTSALPPVVTEEKVEENELPPENSQERKVYELTAKIMAILSHLAVVLGMVAISIWHFDNIRSGIAASTLYLMLPYTAIWTGYVTYSLPAALLVWAIALYRKPIVAGVLLGAAISVIYYPLYLLPLWVSFYWRRGRRRFLGGVLVAVAFVVASLAFSSTDFATFWEQIRAIFGFRLPTFDDNTLGGIWVFWDKVYRLPLLACFLCMAIGIAFWPAQKNLGTLMSCSAAVMLGTQFWHPTTSGLAMAWYLPLVLLTIFRPNLEDRVAKNVITHGWGDGELQ